MGAPKGAQSALHPLGVPNIKLHIRFFNAANISRIPELGAEISDDVLLTHEVPGGCFAPIDSNESCRPSDLAR